MRIIEQNNEKTAVWCHDPWLGKIKVGAQWIWSLAVSMPDRWRVDGYMSPEYAAPGAVVLKARPEIREALKELTSEDLQLNLRSDLLPYFCISSQDWRQHEWEQEISKMKLEFDARMRR